MLALKDRRRRMIGVSARQPLVLARTAGLIGDCLLHLYRVSGIEYQADAGVNCIRLSRGKSDKCQSLCWRETIVVDVPFTLAVWLR